MPLGQNVTVDSFTRLEDVASDWDELADELDASPFLRPGWIARWWKAFGRGRSEIIAVRVGGCVKAIMPVYQYRGALYSPTNWHTPSFGPLAAAEGPAFRLAQALFASHPRKVTLSFLDDEATSWFVKAALPAGYRVLSRPMQHSPYLSIRGSWGDFEHSLSKKLRTELRRRQKRLEELGDVKVEVSDGTVNLEGQLDDGYRIEGAGWKGERNTAIQSRLDTRRFYTDVARWAADRGWLRLAFLRIGGLAIAFDYCLEDNRRHYLLKTGYDPAYNKYGPGMLLRYHMLARVFGNGIASYEFLGGDSAWKRSWTNTFRTKLLLQAFASSPLGVAEFVAYKRGRQIAKRCLELFSRPGAHVIQG
jgi:CelD/BcsL family acetyltransferase involved in cellulose biosynthesis